MKKMLKILCIIMLGLALTACNEGSSNANVTNPPVQPEISEPSEPTPPKEEKVDFSDAINEIKDYLANSIVLYEDFTIVCKNTYANISFSVDILLSDPEEAVALFETDVADGFIANMEYNETTVTITITKIKTE